MFYFNLTNIQNKTWISYTILIINVLTFSLLYYMLINWLNI